MNSSCPTHDCEHEKQDVGRGKWVPVCPQCEAERKAALASAFAPRMIPRIFCASSLSPSVPYHEKCGCYHDEGACPVGSRGKVE